MQVLNRNQNERPEFSVLEHLKIKDISLKKKNVALYYGKRNIFHSEARLNRLIKCDSSFLIFVFSRAGKLHQFFFSKQRYLPDPPFTFFSSLSNKGKYFLGLLAY